MAISVRSEWMSAAFRWDNIKIFLSFNDWKAVSVLSMPCNEKYICFTPGDESWMIGIGFDQYKHFTPQYGRSAVNKVLSESLKVNKWLLVPEISSKVLDMTGINHRKTRLLKSESILNNNRSHMLLT